MCLVCLMEMEPTVLNFQVLGSKWGESQVAGSSGGEVSYSFATQNYTGQLSDFDSFLRKTLFEKKSRSRLQHGKIPPISGFS